MAEENIIIIVPHQDDETNLAGNIMPLLKEHWNIIIVYSSLDTRKRFGEVRKREAINACQVWGIPADNLIFLEYPDMPNKAGNHYFTQGDKRIVSDLKNIILKYRSDYILGTDFDFHSDHRMLSLALDEAVKKAIMEEKAYHPVVLKGFCYETAYYGVEDYVASNLKPCVPKQDILSNASFEWNNRLSIGNENVTGFIWKRKTYQALKKHKSQYAILHAKSIVNADNVFWIKRTDNLLYDADLSVSSGNAEKLRDFKVIDTDDIRTINPRKIDYSKALWIPDKKDHKPEIHIAFGESQNVKYLVLHGNPNKPEAEKLSGQIIINKNRSVNLNQLNAFGRATMVPINVYGINSIDIYIKEKPPYFGISEIEIFNRELVLDSLFKSKKNLAQSKNRPVLNFINDTVYNFVVIFTKIKRKIRTIISER